MTTSSTPITSGQSLTLNLNTTLKVCAFESGLQPSSVISGQYTVVGLVAAGTQRVISLKNDGTVWAWGANSSGQLGTGNTQSASQPIQLNVTNAAPIVNSLSSNAAVQNGIPVAWLENPVVAFGAAGKGTPLYANQSYVHSGIAESKQSGYLPIFEP